ncbi:MAG: HAD family hydrolase [Solirubrobacteraceae bacterium]|jgi:putative hydrolase of the HAD superfamily
MSTPAAVVFDLDETLFDHRGAAVAGVRGWLSTLDVTATDELVDLWFEAEERHVTAWHRGEVAFAEQRRRRLREILALIGRPCGSDDELDFVFADYVACYEAGWRRFDDVQDALELIADAGLRVAVLTNGAELIQQRKLAAVGLAGRVGPVLSCDTIGYAKPDPRAYLRACRELGVAADRALHVGDRYDLDVVAARAAGLPAVHLDRSDRGPHDEPARITSLRELGRFLEGDLMDAAR